MRVRVNGVEIAYDERGRGARPLVLVHGFTGFRGDFASQLDVLGEERRVLAPDLRGHGASGRSADPADYTLARLGEDLVGFLDALDVADCDLLGHSMGGMLALRAALARPERIASLVLMNTAPGPLVWVDPGQLALASRVASEAGMAALATILRMRARDDPQRGAPDRRVEREWGEERFWAWRTARIEAMDPAAYVALGRALIEQEDLSHRLGAVRAPTTVLVGELDAEFRAPAAALARGIPGAHLVVISGAGHQPQHEAPAAWRAAVVEHLGRARAG
jgi:pimeloyl-ACP methyl ester carboxylesterase